VFHVVNIRTFKRVDYNVTKVTQ